MPRFRTALLAAIAIGAGIPAMAVAQQGERDRGDQRGDRPDRGQSGQRPDQGGQRFDQGQGRRDGQDRPQAQPQAQAPPQQQQPAIQGGPDGRGFQRGDRRQDYGQPGQRPDGEWRGYAGGRDDRRPGFDPRQGYDQRRGDQRQGFDQRNDPRQGFGGNDRGPGQRFAGDRGRDDREQGFRGPGEPQGRIGTDWRNDRRYDWRGYRDNHRQIFRAGRYQPPRAYYNRGYRAFQVGFRLDPFFYASNYWIDDPYDYRLPPVWGAYRWVRYYDDVLLVDLSSGQIVDVIHQFFW